MTTEKPNVLLIITDDLGADVLKFVGDQAIAQAPGTKKYRLSNLSKLLKNGINFTQTWAHPVCSATRATVFTGLHPWQTGVGFASFLLPDPSSRTTALIGLNLDDTGANLTGLNPSGVVYEMPTETADGHRIETYADVLARVGYQCSFFGKWDQGYMINFNNNVADPKAIKENGPIHRGWHHFEGVFGGGVDPNASAFPGLDPRLYWTWQKEFQDAAKPPTTHAERIYKNTSERLVAGGYAYATADSIYSARDWIKKNAGSPWCTTLALHAPHYPYHVPPEGTYTIDEIRGTAEELNQIGQNGVEEQAKFVAMIEAMDHYLGKFLEDPDIQDELKQTIIIFLGDNGSPGSVVDLDNDLIKEAKRSVYLNGVYVPMVIADGRAVLGGEPFYLHPDDLDTDNFQMVQVSDIFQTIIDLGGGDTPTGYKLDTSSLVPYLKRDTTHPNPRLYNFGQYFINPGIVPKPTQRAAITDGAYKLSYQGDGSDYGGRGIPAAVIEKAKANHKIYEFSELMTNPLTGLQVERYINDLSHPKAQELWSILTDKNSRYYAELDNLGKPFPPLPTDTPPLTRIVASDSYTQQVGSFSLKPNRLVIGDKTAAGEEVHRAKITFDLSKAQLPISEATLYLCPIDLVGAKVFIEPLNSDDKFYPPEAGDSSQRLEGKMGGDGRIQYDVTAIIQGWLTNPSTNHGFRILIYPTPDAQEAGDVPRPIEFYNHYDLVFGPMLVIEKDISTLVQSVLPITGVESSSVESNLDWLKGENAIDGNESSRWASDYSDPEWILIDLGTTRTINKVRLHWEAAYGKAYQIQVSNDKSDWTAVYTETNGNGGVDEITLPTAVTGRYVRMYGTQRGTGWGYSLYEFSVSGLIAAEGATTTPLPEAIQDKNSLVLHLDGDNYQAGDVWEDGSGRGNHANKADGCTMPVLHEVVNYNGKTFKVMRFADDSGMILPDTLDVQEPYTVMIIDRYYGSVKGRTLQSRELNWLLGKWNGQNGCLMWSWVHHGTYRVVDNVFNLNTVTLTQDRAAAWYLDGKLEGNLAREYCGPGKLGLCKGGLHPEVSEADIAAILIWNRVLSDTERRQVEQWLSRRYGIELKG